jgi:NAD-dependent dihydropyrimidine dehydrogenase PreA subunit
MRPLRYLKNVSSLRFERAACNGCGRCLQVCPHAVLRKADRWVEIQDLDACMECGACTRNCPTHALTVRSGVGCASAILTGWLYQSEPTCDCACACDSGRPAEKT